MTNSKHDKDLQKALDKCWYKIGYLNICDRDQYNALLSEASNSVYSAYSSDNVDNSVSHDERREDIKNMLKPKGLEG